MRALNMRWAVALLLSVGALVGINLISIQPSFAVGDSTCPHGANQESTACFYGVAQYGDFTEFHNNNMYFTNLSYEESGGHINQTLWAYSGAPCSSWQELGLTQGYHGQVAYLWYWAYYNYTSNTYQDFPLGYTSPNGTLHTYEILYDGNAQYTAYLDYGAVGTIGGLGYGTCIASTGLEVSNGEMPVTHSDTFTMNPLQWEGTNGVWNFGWNAGQYWVDNPCGAGYSPPNCANGTFNGSNNQWNDNKP